MPAVIRSAQLEDAGPISRILQEMGWFERMQSISPQDAQDQVTSHLRQCLQDKSHSIYVVVDEQGQVAGYGNVHWLPYLFLPGPEGYISELFVSDRARGMGAGTELLRTIRDEAIRRGCYRLSLLNGRHRESYHRKFYEMRGWEERPTMANFVYWLQKED